MQLLNESIVSTFSSIVLIKDNLDFSIFQEVFKLQKLISNSSFDITNEKFFKEHMSNEFYHNKGIL